MLTRVSWHNTCISDGTSPLGIPIVHTVVPHMVDQDLQVHGGRHGDRCPWWPAWRSMLMRPCHALEPARAMSVLRNRKATFQDCKSHDTCT